jgi:hypothetical protein
MRSCRGGVRDAHNSVMLSFACCEANGAVVSVRPVAREKADDYEKAAFSLCPESARSQTVFTLVKDVVLLGAHLGQTSRTPDTFSGCRNAPLSFSRSPSLSLAHAPPRMRVPSLS